LVVDQGHELIYAGGIALPDLLEDPCDLR
jgi:hypothetical protein